MKHEYTSTLIQIKSVQNEKQINNTLPLSDSGRQMTVKNWQNLHISNPKKGKRKVQGVPQSQTAARSPQYEYTHHVWWKSIDIHSSYRPEMKKKQKRMNKHTDNQYETIISRHYHAAGDNSIYFIQGNSVKSHKYTCIS